ncbi:MAG: methionine--tRNA ligase [Clostridia bacterium]|jgi:methionyl-tRNA synthetase|nr:methionine--tRNA ligase [Clostridia bacterium]
MEQKKYYITTPIYYPSGNWHIGHCYTTVICDALARFHKMLGEDVFFLTGTDEHGQKIEKEAAKRGVTPLQFIDPLVAQLKDMWKLLDISYDRFIRTTDEDHVQCVQKIYQKLYESGDIYKAEYAGWYCTPCESMWTEAQLKGGKCPDCGREVKLQKEESYFFRLSKYAPKILKLYEENPEFLQPKSRVNEMVNNFLKAGLQDLCVSRTTVKWGVPLPFDRNHYAYVWIDALSNYISALGYLSEDDSLFRKYWAADLHLVGKEIVRFHAIIWPAILMALGVPVPKQVYGHGWLLIGGEKLSKSKSDAVKTELADPYELVKRYGADAVRYFLLREIPFGSDGEYTNEKLLARINSDLANDLGNLVSRTTAMIGQYFGGALPARGKEEGTDGELIATANGLFARVRSAMDRLNAPEALSEIFAVVSRANKYIDETTPWILAKDEGKRARLGGVLYNLAETVRICAVMLKPFLTQAPAQILRSLSYDENAGLESAVFGGLQAGAKIEKLPPIFPRIDIKKELKEVEQLVLSLKKAQKQEGEKEQKIAQISIEDFAKTQLQIGEIIACERVAKSEKLLHETVKVGGEIRSVVSGIAKYYTPEEMVGKKVVLVTNLKPVKLCGVLSEGMILCAENADGTLSLLSPERDTESGAKVR